MSRGRVGLLLAVLGLGACHASRQSVSSGQIGCDPSEISISQGETHLGYGENAETWVAECQGRRFYCSRLNTATGTGKDAGIASQVSCKEALSEASTGADGTSGSAAPAIERGPAPVGAAGFTLGADVAHEKSACEGAGNQWQALGAEYTCSGSASPLGFDTKVTLRICDDKVCGISLSHRPAAQWMTFVGDLKDKLEAKYGAPGEADDLVPRECKDEEAFARCLDAGKMRLRFGWKWPTGEHVALIVGQLNNANAASVLIEYSKPVNSAL
jgi:hypothetical protein